ncbi:MAG: DHHA1 domain-containing protein, partial [Vicinamibacteria bacterium]
RAAERLTELVAEVAVRGRVEAGAVVERLGEEGEEIAGVRVIAVEAQSADQRALLDLADRIKQRHGDAAVVLGGRADGKVALVASFTKSAVERGLSAAAVIEEAAGLIGGGGGGRDDAAQAGGRNPAGLEDALQAAVEAIRRGLGA